ncbi:stage II sporulation protein D [Haloplasma contractile]|uniref:Stage II sporulation protein D n=1 Tax=Haloplasma contractile SSD-17B TaxID=1033810 RepID=U2FER2_9MOLU|nr:stage II sporulation protein D [Haloplasma contractile]ERJ11435.1 Stage II sporulation protein D [Haloplasma contractile SSD-17B]
MEFRKFLRVFILFIICLYTIPFLYHYLIFDDYSESPEMVKVYRTKKGEFAEVPLEEYVIGVVAAEMPATFETDALKAQAIAARTYVLKYKQGKDYKDKGYITDSTTHQVYKSDDELRGMWGEKYYYYNTKISQAVLDTKGKVIVYQDELIVPVYFSMSNGYTESSSDFWGYHHPYLQSVESVWDQNLEIAEDVTSLSVEEVNRILGINLKDNNSVGVIKETEGKRVAEIELDGKTFSGAKVMDLLGLKSSDFELDVQGNQVVFITHGFGHGVGMSQYGAQGMAKAGKDYDEIIHYYYKDVKIVNYGN